MLVPIREKRLKHLYETGAIDAELERIIAESERDEQLRKQAGAEDQSAGASTLDQLIEELNEQIENAQETHASDEELAVLFRLRAQLKSKRGG